MYDNPLFYYAPDLTEDMSGQWRISRVQILNWGTLNGYQDFYVPRKGLLLTGESGSGKSTVIDAINTVLNRDTVLQFNMAASGGTGNTKDRTILTYIRGVFGGDSDDQPDLNSKLRPDTTRSAIALSFDNNKGQIVTALRAFFITGKSSDSSALRKKFFLLDAEINLAECMSHAVDKNFANAMSKYFDAHNLEYQTYASSNEFVTQLYRRVGIETIQAAELLQKTISTKNASSLDRLMRQYMLDAPDTFMHAQNAVDEFENLREAHRSVVDAEKQIAELLPIKDAYNTYTEQVQIREGLERLQLCVAPYRYELLIDVAKAQLQEEKQKLLQVQDEITKNDTLLQELSSMCATLSAQIDKNGGQRLKELHAEKAHLLELQKTVLGNLRRLDQALSLLGNPELTSESQFSAIQDEARFQFKSTSEASDKLNEQWADVRSKIAQKKAEELEVQSEIDSLQSRNSSLSTNLVQLRDKLSRELKIKEDAFPFMAELIDIEDKRWRGALERLLHDIATTMLVPTQFADRVARWVDENRLADASGKGMRLVWQRVPNSFKAKPFCFNENSALAKLKIANHSMSSWVEDQLMQRADYVCVNSPSELAAHDFAITMRGQIRRKNDHVKDDRRRIDDPKFWICGTSNLDRLKALHEQLRSFEDELEELLRDEDLKKKERKAADIKAQTLQLILAVEWKDIDTHSIAERISFIESQIQELANPNSDLTKLQLKLTETQNKQQNASTHSANLTKREGAIEDRIKQHQAEIENSEAELENQEIELTEDERSKLAALNYQRVRLHTRDDVDASITNCQDKLLRQHKEADRIINNKSDQILRHETQYMAQWPNFTQNFVNSIEGVKDFISRLDDLQKDNLPAFKQRFRDLLATLTQKNLTMLMNILNSAFDQVHTRINEVNDSLSKTPFDSKNKAYLRLEVVDARSSDAKRFITQLREITQMTLSKKNDSDEEAEARFKKVDNLIKRLQDPKSEAWRRDVLDTRQHVSFKALVENDGQIVDTYYGSKGRSGGQSQKLVAFCLAAALRYRLADPGSYEPRYGSIILDEAFDKADSEFTRDALTVFKEFGFQLILAVPNSKIMVLEEFVDGIYMSKLSPQHTTIWTTVPFVDKKKVELSGASS